MYQLLRKRVAGKKGFTLIELIVVIAVIAILAVILIPRFTGFTKSARQKSAISDARNVLMALEAMDAEAEFPTATALEGAVDTYLGKNLGGRIYDANNTGGKIDFKYTILFGNVYYTVTCEDGVILDNVADATTDPVPGGYVSTP